MTAQREQLVQSSEQDKRSLAFTNADFSKVQVLVSTHTGITVSEHKRDLIYSRLSHRLRVHGFAHFREYLALLENNPGEELEHFINAVTTNLTSFFREEHHFDYLMNDVIPSLM